MARILITYRLASGVTCAAHEAWVREKDYPGIRGLRRVASFVTHRVTQRLFSGEGPAFDYAEILETDDLDGLLAQDVLRADVQALMATLTLHAENPQFHVLEAVA